MHIAPARIKLDGWLQGGYSYSFVVVVVVSVVVVVIVVVVIVRDPPGLLKGTEQ